MKHIVAILFVTFFGMNMASNGQAMEQQQPKVLVAYFSHTNNTKGMAEELHSQVGGTLFRIVPQNPYPSVHRDTERVSRNELDNNLRPKLAATISPEEMSTYDIIFLGFPNWWTTMPMPLFTFLEQYDLSGKTVIPFCTHGGSGLGSSTRDLAKLVPNSTILQGLAIQERSLSNARSEITNWLHSLGLSR